MKTSLWLVAVTTLPALLACAQTERDRGVAEPIETTRSALSTDDARGINTGSRNLHLQRSFRFNPIQPGADANLGRALFGLSPDLDTPDSSGALFQGFSMAAGREISSNGRSCFTCHRGKSVGFGMPKPPLSATIPATDPLFSGISADAQGDPDAPHNLDQLGLIKYRPGRFNPQLPESDAFRRIFFWRKSPRLLNIAFNRGFLLEGRARVLFEADRGAIFSHTQPGDDRFDDLFSTTQAAHMEAFQFAQVTDPRLNALRDPSNPLFTTLTQDPFYTVPISTKAQRHGSEVFARSCMTCHSTPNVFNNLDNVEPTGADRPVTDPAFGPTVGRAFNIGISERNQHHLRFTYFNGSGFEPIVVELAAANGDIVHHTVTTDIGLAASTRYVDDIGRFKVPQLRGIKDAAPYFHDNSAATLEEAVDYHTSSDFSSSKDGRNFPIHLDGHERADLLEFLRIL